MIYKVEKYETLDNQNCRTLNRMYQHRNFFRTCSLWFLVTEQVRGGQGLGLCCIAQFSILESSTTYSTGTFCTQNFWFLASCPSLTQVKLCLNSSSLYHCLVVLQKVGRSEARNRNFEDYDSCFLASVLRDRHPWSISSKSIFALLGFLSTFDDSFFF